MNILAILAVLAPALLASSSEGDKLTVENVESVDGELIAKGCPRSCNQTPINDCHCPKGYIAFLTYNYNVVVDNNDDVTFTAKQTWQCLKYEEDCRLKCPTTDSIPAGSKGYCVGNTYSTLPNCSFPNYFFTELLDLADPPITANYTLYAAYKDNSFYQVTGALLDPTTFPCNVCEGRRAFCGTFVPFPETPAGSFGLKATI